jgi:branched-chain amino acid transport system permease protein
LNVGQYLVDGVLLGGMYAAVASGFALVWGIMNIVNLSHGALVVLGAYVAYWLFALLGVDPFLAIPVAMAALFVVGWLIQRVLINRVVRAPVLMTFLITFGLSLVVTDLIVHAFSTDFRSIIVPYAAVGLRVGGVVVPFVRTAALLVAVALVVLLATFLGRTRSGQAILATGMDAEAARLVGIDVAQIYALTFAVGAALAGAAGALFAVIYPISPDLGDPVTLRAFVVVVLGGLGNVYGALLGGLVFGLAQVFGSAIFGAGYEDAIAFGILVLVLVSRPRGLAGRSLLS